MEQTELALIAIAAVILALMGLGGLLHFRKRRQGGLFPALMHWSRNIHNLGAKMKILPPDSARWYVFVCFVRVLLGNLRISHIITMIKPYLCRECCRPVAVIVF